MQLSANCRPAKPASRLPSVVQRLPKVSSSHMSLMRSWPVMVSRLLKPEKSVSFVRLLNWMLPDGRKAKCVSASMRVRAVARHGRGTHGRMGAASYR